MRLDSYAQQVYRIVGAAMDVHKELHSGLLEPVYNEALCVELARHNIEFQSEQELPVYYKGEQLQKHYRMDIVCGDIILELKAVSELLAEHRAQLFNYLRLTKKPIGLLINFGESSLHVERYYFAEDSNTISLFHVNRIGNQLLTDI